ncbi:MAG: lysophospholipid acyltransferase family protein [Myxococcota bacterium]
MLEPWRRLLDPVFLGLENVPSERPLLFVGNHTLYGLWDIPLMIAELYWRQGIFLRSLGDHVHFQLPLWREMMSLYGVVDGTRQNCAQLMQQGECILVFPGGGREVAKRKGERYALFWKDRTGFARLAIRHRCTIIPFSAVGIDDALTVLYDADDMFNSPLGPLLAMSGVRREVLLPLVRGVGPTPVPRPERLYFRFGEPITTREFAGRSHDGAACCELRNRVKRAVEEGVHTLLSFRANDPHRHFAPRLVRDVRRWWLARAGPRQPASARAEPGGEPAEPLPQRRSWDVDAA